MRKEALRILNHYVLIDKLREKEKKLGSDHWKNPEHRKKQEITRKSEEYLEIMKKALSGKASPNWINNRSQLNSSGHTVNFHYLCNIMKEVLWNQQLGLDGLSGQIFNEYDILHRHHIDFDKSNDLFFFFEIINFLSSIKPYK